MIIGAALYTDALQEDEIEGINNILKSHSCLKKLTTQNPVERSVTKVMLSKMNDENGGKVYQGAELHRFRDNTSTS